MAKIKKIKLPNDSTEYEFEGSVTDISDTTSNIDSITTDYPDVSASDKASTLFGKIKKFLSDLKSKKQDNVTGAASTITSSNLTANRILQSDANGKVAASGYEFDINTNNTSDTWLLVMKDSKIQHRLPNTLSVKSAESATNATYIKPLATGRASNPNDGNSIVIFKRVTSSEAPDNGVVLEFGNSASWRGQLYIGDNSTRGIAWNGWSRGTRGSWLTFLHSGNYTDYCIKPLSQSGSIYAGRSLGVYASSETMIAGTDKGNRIWSCSSGSDKRLKKNIKDSEVKGLELINAIHLVEFDFKDKKFGTHEEIGYIAQELIDIIPEAVVEVPTEEEDKKYGDSLLYVEDKPLIKYLVKAVQELTDIVDKQQIQIDELKNRVVALKEVIEY